MSAARGRAWAREELILAINLYCKISFGSIHYGNPKIIALAELLERTPGSVSYKLANLASIDPALARKGATNASKLDRAVWEEFFADWDGMVFESERLLAARLKVSLEETVAAASPEESAVVVREGTTREALVRQRVNQGFFRKMVLESYHSRCCITGLAVPSLLNASHIVPWAARPEARTDPRNGLCLNALHDRAFDRGLITLDEASRVVVSSEVMALPRADAEAIQEVAGKPIVAPHRFLPDPEYVAYHREHVFR